MRNSFIKGLLTIPILTLTILSCKENEKNVVPEHLNAKKIEVKEGRLNFNKLEDFNNEISNLSRSSRSRDYSSIVKDRIDKNAKFSTLRKSPQELSHLRTSEIEIDTLIQDDLFASFLNDQREISVDDIIYKITPEGT